MRNTSTTARHERSDLDGSAILTEPYPPTTTEPDGAPGVIAHRVAEGTNGTAVILPGLNYHCRRPLLAAMRGVFEQRSATVWELDFPYAADTDLMAMPKRSVVERVAADGVSIARWARRIAPDTLWLVGKSLGTVSMGGAVDDAPDALGDVGLVWLTPSPWVLGPDARAARNGARSLVVIGTADPAYRDELLDPVARSGARVVRVQGADHGFHHSEGNEASRRAIEQATDAVRAFVG